MILNCVIVDDEPLAVELLASYARKIPFLNLVGTFNSAAASIKTIREKTVDLLFLDIQMPELSGMEYAKIINEPTKIVFTTAFSQYAVDGYRINAFDYLLKPISFEEFMRVGDKALKCLSEKNVASGKEANGYIFVKSDYKLVRINFKDILYAEGVKDYVKIYLKDGSSIKSLACLRNLIDFLPSPQFLRVHRSFIVNIDNMKTIDRSRFVVGDKFIPISDTYKEQLQKIIDEHTLD